MSRPHKPAATKALARAMYATGGYTQQYLAWLFDVDDATISRWVQGETKAEVIAERMAEARRLFATGFFLKRDLAKQFGVSSTTISTWLTGLKPIRHGSVIAYAEKPRGHACRCDVCVEAFRERKRAYYEANKERLREYHREYAKKKRNAA